MRILIKISGDLVKDRRVIERIREFAKKDDVTLIHGAGTQISNALKAKNIPYEFIEGVRHTTDEGLEVCFNESENVRKELEKELEGVNVAILSPVSEEDGKISNKNAEEIFRTIQSVFEKKIVFTISGREKPFLTDIKNVEVIKLEPLQESIMRL
jgi:acetylglutamate kinase